MALETNTLSAALAALIGGGEASSNPSTSLFIPLCNASGQITSRVSIADLATVAAGLTLSTPKEIARDSNLNNFFAPGTYNCTGSNAPSVVNCPYTNSYGFTLLSIGINAEYTTQVLFSRMGVYMRFQTNPWKQIYTFLT
jgi:hypothetical protein